MTLASAARLAARALLGRGDPPAPRAHGGLAGRGQLHPAARAAGAGGGALPRRQRRRSRAGDRCQYAGQARDGVHKDDGERAPAPGVDL
jgi:hypothetical protein